MLKTSIMKEHIFIIPLLIVSIISCTNTNNKIIEKEDPCLSGHIIFMYEGEQDKPVAPFSIVTQDDSTIYNYWKEYLIHSSDYYNKNEIFTINGIDVSYFVNTFGDSDFRLERVPVNIYRQIRERLVSFSNLHSEELELSYNDDYSSYGCYIIDKCDTLYFNIPSKKNISEHLYLDLWQTAVKYRLGKAEKHFNRRLSYLQ